MFYPSKPKLRFLLVCLALVTVICAVPSLALSGDPPKTEKIGYDPKLSQQTVNAAPNAKDLYVAYYLDEYVDPTATYKITDANGLKLFASLVNMNTTYNSLSVYLANDIDMSGVTDFRPIANGTDLAAAGIPMLAYKGSFYGFGHTVDNLKMTSTDETANVMQYVSLFGVLGSSATVRDLVIGEGCDFSYMGNSANACTAALAGRVIEGATVSNVLSLATVSGGAVSGGLIARVDHESRGTYKSKILTFSNCSNAGAVSGRGSVGGLIGTSTAKINLFNCRNTGKLSFMGSNLTDPALGGLIGKVAAAGKYLIEDYVADSALVNDVSLMRSVNYGSIPTAGIVGGMVGDVKDLEQTVRLSMTDCVQGGNRSVIIGRSETEVDITGCTDASGAVRLHGSQVRVDDRTGEKYSVRFVGSVSSLNYTEVGFLIKVTVGGQTSAEKTLACQQVFRSMIAGSDGKVYTAEDLRGDDKAYLFAMTVNNIPYNSSSAAEFEVTPYAKTISGVTELGESFTVTYQNGVYLPAWEQSIGGAS